MTFQIRDNINEGLAYAYPLCCVLWFSLVWKPSLKLGLDRADTDTSVLVFLLRGKRKNCNLGYVPCPACRTTGPKRREYMIQDEIDKLRRSDYPLAETVVRISH